MQRFTRRVACSLLLLLFILLLLRVTITQGRLTPPLQRIGEPCAVANGGGTIVNIFTNAPMSTDHDKAHSSRKTDGFGCNATHCIAGYEAVSENSENTFACRACAKGTYKHFADLGLCLPCENNIASVRLYYTHTAETHRFCHYVCRDGRLGPSCTNPITAAIYALSGIAIGFFASYVIYVIHRREQALKDR